MTSQPAPGGGLRLAVVIATLGRPGEVAGLLRRLAAQTRPPDRLVLSVTDRADVPPDAADRWGAEVVAGPKGLCAQRNRGLDLVRGDCDIVVFFDDDYVPASSALAGVAAVFATFPDVAGMMGRLLADGINSAGIADADAAALIATYEATEPQGRPPRIVSEHRGLYGCNMAYRTAMICDARFDENLPLYAWQEDVDFAAQLLARGRLVKSDALVGVHKGVKGGRLSERRLGYSQIANPVYLIRKGTMRLAFAARLMLGNIAANHLKAFAPEPWVDRRGRMRGNWIAIKDMVLGRLTPTRMLDL